MEAESRGNRMRYLSPDKTGCRYRYIILGVDTDLPLYIFIPEVSRSEAPPVKNTSWISTQ